jgi:hypothetical protein
MQSTQGTSFTVTKFRWKKFPFTYPEGFSAIVVGTGTTSESDQLREKKETEVVIEMLKEVFPSPFVEGKIEDMTVGELKVSKTSKTHFIFITKKVEFPDVMKFDDVKYKIFVSADLKLIPKSIVTEASLVVAKDLLGYMKSNFSVVTASIFPRENVFFIVDKTGSQPTFHGLQL